MKILIVEPHPDDAILSVFGATRQWVTEGNDVSIVSVAENHQKDSSNYCEYVRVKCLKTKMFPDVNFKSHRIPFNVIKEQGNQSYLYQREHYISAHSSVYNELHQWYNNLLSDQLFGQFDMIVYPVGILHPFHVIVSSVFERICTELAIAAMCYADMPYSNKGYGKVLIESAISSTNLRLYQEIQLAHGEVKRKLQLFRTFYKGESIHWDEPGMYEHSEKLFVYGAE